MALSHVSLTIKALILVLIAIINIYARFVKEKITALNYKKTVKVSFQGNLAYDFDVGDFTIYNGNCISLENLTTFSSKYTCFFILARPNNLILFFLVDASKQSLINSFLSFISNTWS